MKYIINNINIGYPLKINKVNKMHKHIIVSEDTHKKFKKLAKNKGMKFDGLLNKVIKDYSEKETGIKDLSMIAYLPNRTGKIVGDNEMTYEVVGEHTSWDINCDCCGSSINNSTEIDICTGFLTGTQARINSCHYCTNTHVMPLLQKTQVDGNVSPHDLVEYIIDKYKNKEV